MSNKIFYEKEFDIFRKLDPYDFSKISLNKKREIVKNKISYNFDYPIKYKNETFKLNNNNDINVMFFYPNDYNENDNKEYSFIYYIHGGGWCLDCGDYKIPSELCHLTNSIVLYPMYSLSPEAKFPQQIYELYDVLCLIKSNSKPYNINLNSLCVIGDSSGAQIALGIALLNKLKGNEIKINKQILLNPPLDSKFDSPSFSEFEHGYFITKAAVKWCYNSYISNENDYNNILLCPLKCTIEQLSHLPETLLIHADYDVLKDDGILFGKRLAQAGVNVTSILFKSTTHSFLIFNQLKNTKVSKLCLNVLISFLNDNNNITSKL